MITITKHPSIPGAVILRFGDRWRVALRPDQIEKKKRLLMRDAK